MRKPIYSEIDKRFATKDYAGALAVIDYGLAQDVHDVTFYRAKARIYHVMRDFRRAEYWYSALINNSPPALSSYVDRAAARNDMSDYPGVIEDLDVAELMKKDDPGLYLKRGGAHWEMRDWGRAQADFTKSLELAPDNPDAVWVNGLLDLQMGRFDTGWPRYEARWKSSRFKSNRLVTDKPQWTPGSGKRRVLVWGEQGLGDQIFYAGMLPVLRSMVNKVTMMVDPRLVTIFARSFPDVDFVPNTAEIDADDHDSHLPIASIGAQFIHSLSDLERLVSVPFLRPDAARVQEIATKIPTGRLVGLSWTSAAIKIGPHKSMALEDLEPILLLSGYKFVNVQYINSSTEKKDPRILLPPVDCRNDIEGLAAFLTLCDSLVSVSSTTVHLAAALGVKVRLADANKLWYWGNKKDDYSLWYPSVKIYPRRNIKAPWTDVIDNIKTDMGECL